MKRMSALSIRQPYVEQILRGNKKIEYRSMPTKKRGRVYIYASLTPAPSKAWKEVGLEPGDLPTGVIVGTIEIVNCRKVRSTYEWDLVRPIRLKRPLKPKRHPQPSWFFPF